MFWNLKRIMTTISVSAIRFLNFDALANKRDTLPRILLSSFNFWNLLLPLTVSLKIPKSLLRLIRPRWFWDEEQERIPNGLDTQKDRKKKKNRKKTFSSFPSIMQMQCWTKNAAVISLLKVFFFFKKNKLYAF